MRPVRYMQIKICFQCIQRDFDKIQIKSGILVRQPVQILRKKTFRGGGVREVIFYFRGGAGDGDRIPVLIEVYVQS